MKSEISKLPEPYKGLQPYEEENQDIFFGRETEREILIDKIFSNKLTLLFAGTGVGKSSLLQASVLSELKRPDRENLDVVYYKDWVSGPLSELKKTVIQTLQKQGKVSADYDYEDDVSLKAFLQICSTFASEPLVVMLDQFEEFFQYQRYQEGFHDFVRELAESVNDRETPVVFVISMREDFALELNEFKEHLPTTLFENYFRLEKLEIDKAKEAIERPVKKVGFQYESGLLDEILRDLAEREKERRFGKTSTPFSKDIPAYVEPPYLQIVCRHLWEAEQRNPERIIRKKAYLESGRAKGFVDSYFEEVMTKFSPAEKSIASRSFNHLITPYGTKMAYPIRELSSLIRVDEKEMEKVLEKLRNARILRSQKREGVLWYELYHDIFSNVIYQWNEYYKDSESHYLRLSPEIELSDMIELYRGRVGKLNISDSTNYETETGYCRNQIEPDKLFFEKQIADYDKLNLELIGMIPLEKRIFTYWEAGEIEKTLVLAELSISKGDMNRSENVIKLLATFRSEKSSNILKKHIVPPEDVYIRKEIINAMGSMAPSIAFRHVVILLKDRISSVRRSAVAALGRIGSVEAVPGLIPLLTDQESDVRSSAAEALGRIGSVEAVSRLIPLLTDQKLYVRRSAADALGRLGSIEAVPGLIPLLTDQESDVRRSAADALGRLGSIEAVLGLIPLLTDQNWSVRSSAADALGRLGGVEAVPGLIPLLTDQDSSVRSSAADALGRIGSVEAVPGLIPLLTHQNPDVRNSAADALNRLGNVEAVPRLIPLLSDQDSDMRRYASEALGCLGSVEAVPRLIPLLTDQDRFVRSSAADALGHIGSVQAAPRLIPLLTDQDSYVRISAAEALVGSIGSVEAVPGLIPLLTDQDSDMRRSAAEVLGRIGSVEAVPGLIQLLTDQDSDVRSSAADALARIGSLEAVPGLIQLLTDQDSDVRSSAAEALSRLGSVEAVPGLIQLLTDQDSDARGSAAEALGHIGSVEAVLGLIQLLADQDSDARGSAAEALGCIGSVEAVLGLIQLLADQESGVRSSAAKALGRIGSVEAVPGLIQLLADQGWYVRCSAADALARLGSVKAVPGLIQLLADQEPYVRGSAAEALGRIGSVEAVPGLIQLLADQGWYVRCSAVLALGKLSAFDQTDAIKKLYRNRKEEQNVKLAAAVALLSLNDEEGLAFLREKSKSKKFEYRKYLSGILGKVPSKQGVALLIEMLNSESHYILENSDYKIRAAATKALENIASPESLKFLQKIATDIQERVPARLSAITGLGNIGTQEAVDTLLKILENEKETYQFRAIMALGNTRSVRAVAPLKARLEKERKRKAEWREIRDENTESYTKEQIKDWRNRLEKVKPRTYLEIELAHAISRIAPGTQGVKLLSHDLAAAREGAWMGLGKAGTVPLIQKLHTERKKGGTPWFRHAAYRAIDHILINIQAFGGKQELEQLETFFPEISKEQSIGVHTRVKWTIDRLKDRE